MNYFDKAIEDLTIAKKRKSFRIENLLLCNENVFFVTLENFDGKERERERENEGKMSEVNVNSDLTISF